MLEHIVRTEWPQRTERGSRAVEEVGRFIWGERLYTIKPMPGVRAPFRSEVCSHFDIGDVTFGVFESHRGANTCGDDAANDILRRLSGRELQIAILVAQGHATKTIAYQLQISEWTVATYLRRIFAKLDVDNRAAMVYRCAPLIHASFIGESI